MLHVKLEPALIVLVVSLAVTPVSAASQEDWWPQAAKGIAASEYEVSWQEATYLDNVESAWQAPNRAHDLRTYFTQPGIRVVPRADDENGWELGLALTGYSRGDLCEAAAAVAPMAEGKRVEYRRDSVVEWFVNGRDGLKHGFTLGRRPLDDPAEDGPLRIELAVTGTLSPQVNADGQAIDFRAASGGNALRYSRLLVTDANGATLRSWMEIFRELDRHGIRIVVDDRDALYPVTVDPLLTTPAWTYDGVVPLTNLGFSVATAGDVNRDGYSDVIVGAPYYDAGHVNAGRAYVFHGSASGLLASPTWWVTGGQAGAQLGYSVATAGDVNADGYSDVIVGEPWYDTLVIPSITDAGRVFVYDGSADGIGGTPWAMTGSRADGLFGFAVSTAGDVSCDGYSDIVIGAPKLSGGLGRVDVFYGSATGLVEDSEWTGSSPEEHDRFGYAVATAGRTGLGDCDGVIISAPLANGSVPYQHGKVWVIPGLTGMGLTGLDTKILTGVEWQHLGGSVSPAGDVNGDGYGDIIIGSPGFDPDDVGGVEVHFGGPEGVFEVAPWVRWGTGSGGGGDRVGHSVGSAGDVNGDGFADVIIGAPNAGATDHGYAEIYFGSRDGLGDEPGWYETGGTSDTANYGTSVATAGDVNGDGFSDVIVGAPGFDDDFDNEGRAFVYHGSPDGPVDTAAWTDLGGQAGAALGAAVAGAGDVNGDGYDDIVVAASDYDSGQVDEGAVFVFHGGPDGPAANHDWWADGDQDGARFGNAVAGAGDVNGDRFEDLLVGGYAYDLGETDEGVAWVYHGSSSGLDADGARPIGSPLNADWAGQVDQAYAGYGVSVAGAGDLNGDGYGDIVIGASGYDSGQFDEGAIFVYHGDSGGLSASHTWWADADSESAWFGQSVDGAGDVNGDGYGDLVVGAPHYTNAEFHEGAVFLFLGSITGLDRNGTRPTGSGQNNADWREEGDHENTWLGHAVAGAGDFDGDGLADLIAGAPYFAAGDAGGLFIYSGRASGTPVREAVYLYTQSGAHHGFSVAGVGDVNGDGFADFAAGVPDFDDSEGGTDDGETVVYFGGASSPPFNGVTLASTANGDYSRTGYSVAGAGDVNGDGFADVIVGAPGHEETLTGEGKVYLYYGGNNGGAPYLPRQLEAGGAPPQAPVPHLAASDHPNAIRLSAWARPATGPGKVQLEAEVKPFGVPFDGTGTTKSPAQDSGQAGINREILVVGITPNTPYHWRARLLYDPVTSPFLPRSRWFNMPRGGWSETQFRTPGCVDADSDGYGSPAGPWCPLGLVEDCDDSVWEVHPGATEICDGYNNDCNDPNWPAPATIEADLDSDGYSWCDGDCSDVNAGVHPGKIDGCDGIDNDCDGDPDPFCDRDCDNPGTWDGVERVTSSAGVSELPAIAWTGAEYGLAWEDSRHGSPEIYFARLDSSGALIAGSEVRVTSSTGNAKSPTLTWGGAEFGIVWQDSRDGNDEIYFTRLNGFGVKQGSDIRVTSDAASSTLPSIAWSGIDFAVAWQDDRDTSWEAFYARLAADGSKLAGDVRISDGDAANSVEVSLAHRDQDAYGLVWRDKRDGNWEIYFQTITRDAAASPNVRVTSDGAYSASPDLIHGDSGWGLCWNDARDAGWEVYFARLDILGASLTGDVRVSTDDAHDSWYPSIAWTGTEYGIAWMDASSGDNRIHLSAVNDLGSPTGAEIAVTSDPSSSKFPALAWSGHEYVVAWQDYRHVDWEIYAARVACCDDADSDSWTECENDCNDSNALIHPGATEVCDEIDNNCDDQTDEGYPVPGFVGGVTVDATKDTLNWSALAGADRYDLVRGDLIGLRAAMGGFESCIDGCADDDGADTTAVDALRPATGQGYFYLVRAEADCKSGSYDSAGPQQQGSRDAGIETSGAACP